MMDTDRPPMTRNFYHEHRNYNVANLAVKALPFVSYLRLRL